MTQRDVAEALGRPPSYVGKIEAGERNVSLLEFVTWAHVVKQDPATLFSQVVAALAG